MRKLKIFTWHVHGNYLYYLSQAPHDFYLPYKPDRAGDYIGRLPGFPWLDNVKEVPAEEVRNLDLDCILFQRRSQYFVDQYEILTESQRKLPAIYLEHNPPDEHPTNTRHCVDDPNILLVHVTPYNNVMWDSGCTPTKIVEHGVLIPEDSIYRGDRERGIVVINNLKKRGRRLGADIFQQVREKVPLDLVGMAAEEMNGIGEIDHDVLPNFQSYYRFFFSPIRYCSLGLALCEAMMIGMPIIGLATTEMVTVVENGVSGYIDTRVDILIDRMRELLKDPHHARYLGESARHYAMERFHIQRFIRDWNDAFSLVTGFSGKLKTS